MKDPFISILKIKSRPNPEFQKYINDKDLVVLFELYPIPKFEMKEIQSIENSLNSGKKHNEAVKPFMERFLPFTSKSFDSIKTSVSQISDQETIYYLHRYILNFYLSWIISFDNSHDLIDLYGLITLILDLADSEFKDIAKNCILYLFEIYRTHANLMNFPNYFKLLLLFFQKFNNNADTDFLILTNFFSDLTTYRNDKYAELFMDNFYIIENLFSDEIPQEIYQTLMFNSLIYSTNLSKSGLNFYSVLINHLSDEKAKEVASTLSLVLCQKVLNLQDYPPFPKYKPPPQPFVGSFEIAKTFPDIPTFEKGFVFTFSTANISLPPFKTLQNAELMEQVEPLFQALKLSRVSSIEAVSKMNEFINRYQKNNTTNSLDVFYNLYIMFLSLISSVLNQLLNHISFVYYVFRDEVFNPAFYCFDKNCQTEEIINLNILRTEAFKRMLYDSSTKLFTDISRFIFLPDMFGEMIQRCIDNISIMPIKIIESDYLVEFLSNSLIFYQNLRYKGANIDNEISVKLFFFLSLLLQDESARHSAFESKLFCTAFLTQAYETATREFVFSQIKAAWDSTKMPNAFHEMFRSVFSLFPSENSILLANEMLLVINDIMAVNRSIVDNYSIISRDLFDSLSLLVPSQNASKQFVLSVLQYFTEILYKLTDDDYNKFATAIHTVYGVDNQEVIFQRLIQFLAGESISSVNPSFIIGRPRAILIIFYLYSKSIKSIEYITQLCKYDVDNAKACHQARLDFLVLEAIRSKWDDDSVDKDYLQSLLQLFEAMTLSACSLEILEKFISLLAPINGAYLSPHYQLALDTFFDILRIGMKSPFYQMPFRDQENLIVKTSESYYTKPGFTFVAWLYIDNTMRTNNYPLLFKGWNDKNWSVSVFLKSNVISFLEIGPDYQISSSLDSYLPIREWVRVAITYFVDVRMASLTLFVNGTLAATLKTVLPDIYDWNLRFMFGGLQESTEADRIEENNYDKESLLGPFALYPVLNADVITSVFSDNPNIFSPIDQKPFFSHSPTAITTFHKKTFYSYFVGQCNLNLIIPMYSISYVTFQNNEKYKFLFEAVTSIIFTSLSTCELVEEKFLAMKGFEIISYLLTDANPIYLTYHLYTRFFNIYQALKNEKLQENLFNLILVNMSIWHNSEEQALILKHIARRVTPNETFGFSEILSTILLFYSNIQPAESKLDSLKLSSSRNILYSIIKTIPPTRKMYYLLFNAATNIHDDVDIKTELIQLIGLYAENSPDKFAKQLSPEEIASLLEKLIAESINDAPIPIIELVWQLHKVNRQVELVDIVSSMLLNIKPETASPTLFDRLIEMINSKFYSLFPLLCYIGMQLNWNDTKSLFNLKKNKFTEFNMWFYWLVIWALELENEEQNILMNFIAKAEPNYWIHISALIEKISLAKCKNPDEPQSKFLTQVCHAQICGNELIQSKQIFNNLQTAIGHFLFFRHTNRSDLIPVVFEKTSHETFYDQDIIESNSYDEISTMDTSSTHIYSSFKNLPAQTIYNIVNLSHKNPETSSISSLSSLISGRSDIDYEYHPIAIHFGLRLDENMEWMDFELTKIFFYIMQSFKLLIDPDLFVIIVHFLTKAYQNKADVAKLNLFAKDLPLSEQQKAILLNDHKFDFTHFIESILTTKYSTLRVDFHPRTLGFNMQYARAKSVDFEYELNRLKKAAHNKTSLLLPSPHSSKLMISELLNEEEDLDIADENDYQRLLLDYARHLNLKNHRKLWENLWYELTQEGHAWETSDTPDEMFSRDTTLCSSGTPFKLMKKGKFAKPNTAIEIVYGIDPSLPVFKSEESEHLVSDESCSGCLCKIIKIFSEDEDSEISVHKEYIVIYRDTPKVIHIYSIRSLIHIPYKSRQIAIELSLDDGKSYFLVFQSTNNRNQIFDAICEQIRSYYTKNPQKVVPLIAKSRQTRPVPQSFIDAWKEHKISNFSYILLLNRISGCSFNSETQYPIFPRILDDFNDINSIRTYDKQYSYGTDSPLFYLQRLNQFAKCNKVLFNDISRISDEYELTPEFFFMPEFLIGKDETLNVVLPKWANSPFDFVYKCRKILESEEVSKNLNKWINNIWSEYQVHYCTYLPLFDAPHPERLPLQNKTPIFVERKIDNKNLQQSFEIKGTWKVLCQSKNWIGYYINEDENKIKLRRKDGTRLSNKIEFSFDLKAITTSFISEEFHTIVIGVNNGRNIFVHSLEHKSPVFAIHIDTIYPAEILSISPSWGFIISASTKNSDDNCLSIFNINGMLIRKVNIGITISKLICWSSNAEFDYMAISDIDGNVYVSEIYELSESTFETPFYSCNCQIEKMIYDKINETLIIQTESGKEIVKSV